jgi:hypothetical protein
LVNGVGEERAADQEERERFDAVRVSLSIGVS